MRNCKTLYNQNCRLTDDAQELSDRAFQALEPIFNEFISKGYSPREIFGLVVGRAMDVQLLAVLRMASKPVPVTGNEYLKRKKQLGK
jgi:hypothetical protein